MIFQALDNIFNNFVIIVIFFVETPDSINKEMWFNIFFLLVQDCYKSYQQF